MELKGAEAVFLSCTALPALSIIDKLEKKLNKIVLCSNQVLIWDTLQNWKKNSFKDLESCYQEINYVIYKRRIQTKIKKSSKMMQEKGIELLISQDTNNLNYLTGYDAWSFIMHNV